MININKYEVIMLILCSYYGMSYEEFKKRLKKKDNLYLTLLLMKKFKCLNSEIIQENLGILNNRMLCYRMKKAEEKGVKLMLPVDTKIGKEFKPDTESKTVAWTEIPEGWEGFDIGEKSIKMFEEEIKKAKTVVWNGPLGLFEFDQFAIGTNSIAKVLSEIDATTIIGGGDSAAAVRKAGLEDTMTHISTGGGASLEFLEGKKLPGIECLQDK